METILKEKPGGYAPLFLSLICFRKEISDESTHDKRIPTLSKIT